MAQDWQLEGREVVVIAQGWQLKEHEAGGHGSGLAAQGA